MKNKINYTHTKRGIVRKILYVGTITAGLMWSLADWASQDSHASFLEGLSCFGAVILFCVGMLIIGDENESN